MSGRLVGLRRWSTVAFVLVALAPSCGGGGDGASVTIASPEDGSTVPSPVAVTMEADGFAIERAGAVRDGAGHFHLMVDADCVVSGQPIPSDDAHRHLADGSSETELALPAGEHTLCAQAGDGEHTALDLSDEITITVAGLGAGTETEDDGDEELWRGTIVGRVTRPRCSPEDVLLTGEVELRVGADRRVSGTASERWGSCSVAGTVIPAVDNRYRVSGRKTDAAFELTVSGTGTRRMRVPIEGNRAYKAFLEGSAGYEADITYSLECANC